MSTETEPNLVFKIFSLHETRKTMASASLYHGLYEKLAIELNEKLKTLSGRDYIDYSWSEIQTLVRIAKNTRPTNEVMNYE